MGDILRALRVRYPYLQEVFLSSCIYSGYAISPLNPEPYAYESDFSVTWVNQAQIQQMQNGGAVVNARAGDLNDYTVAPWIAWGPYLWADGTRPRSDGLTWQRSDFGSDGTHPLPAGIAKVGTALLRFLLASAFTRCWFRAPAQQQLDLDVGDGARCTLRHGFFADPSRGNALTYLLDYDIYREGMQAFDVQDIKGTVDAYNDLALQLFQQTITAKMYRFLAGGEE